MAKLNLYTLLILLSFLLQSCNKSETLTASTVQEGYIQQGGSNSYDSAIADIYNKYGSYLYYSFTDKEAYWTPSGWANPAKTTSGTSWVPGYIVDTANKNYVSKQIALFTRGCLNLYSDAFLKKFLPIRVLLCNHIYSVSYNYTFTSVMAWSIYDHLCIGRGNSSIDSMSRSDTIAYMKAVNVALVQNIVDNTKSIPTSEFSEMVNYDNTSFTTAAQAWKLGVITPYYNSPTAQKDWNIYIQAMTTYSDSLLNVTPLSYDYTPKGMLNSTRDVNGLIKKRYTMVRQYFIENYGIDLQTIGNAVN